MMWLVFLFPTLIYGSGGQYTGGHAPKYSNATGYGQQATCQANTPKAGEDAMAYSQQCNKYSDGATGAKTSPLGHCTPWKKINCDPAMQFRSADESCNNLQFPTWAMSNTALERLLPANYADNVFSPAVSVSGKPLPNVRVLSHTLYRGVPKVENPDLTQMTEVFGQLVGHDTSFAPTTQTSAGGIQCCKQDGSGVLPQETLNPSCMPIIIPPNDPFYSQFKQKCMNFVRTMTISRSDCSMGEAEQLTSSTGTVDLSAIYGNNIKESNALRSFQFGRLRTQQIRGRDYPPEHPSRDCVSKDKACFHSGDPRANQTPYLTSVHILLLREHNAIAAKLHELHPTWDDEKLFQEARRLLIAIYQHIVYDNWLPLFMGSQFLDRYITKRIGYEYKANVNPATLNEFTSAAFRYWHTCVHGQPSLVDESRHNHQSIRLSQTYNNPALLLINEGNLDGTIRGSTTNLMAELDNIVTTELTEQLFAMNGGKFGFDMESIDIQRGRDHGLQPYVKYRAYCGLSAVNTFADLRGIMSDERISKLQQLYESVLDIDLFVGGIAENHLTGGRLGPTLQCIYGEQFYRWKVGDRFYFENLQSPYPFTAEQIAEIKKVTIARLICDNADNIQTMQRRAFERISARNPLVSCSGSQIPRLDFSKF